MDERELDERFVRASGPGGQNVNKVSTAVELRFNVATSTLPDDVKARLPALAGKKLSADGVLLIDSREHRTQAQNREAARARLVALLRQAGRRPDPRQPTRPKGRRRGTTPRNEETAECGKSVAEWGPIRRLSADFHKYGGIRPPMHPASA